MRLLMTLPACPGVAVTVMPMVLVHILGVRRFARAWSILWVGLLPGTMAAGPLSGKVGQYHTTVGKAWTVSGHCQVRWDSVRPLSGKLWHHQTTVG